MSLESNSTNQNTEKGPCASAKVAETYKVRFVSRTRIAGVEEFSCVAPLGAPPGLKEVTVVLALSSEVSLEQALVTARDSVQALRDLAQALDDRVTDLMTKAVQRQQEG